MESFDNLGLSVEVCNALSKEGLHHPYELQRNIIPLITRKNNLLIESGPGAGTLISYTAPLLENIQPGQGSPGAIVVTHTREASSKLAEATSRLSISTGHIIGSLSGDWASPHNADIVFGTPEDILLAIKDSQLSTQKIGALIVDGANSIKLASDLDSLKELLGYIGNRPQKVVFSLPITDPIKKLVAQHVSKCLTISGSSRKDTPLTNHQSQKIHYSITVEEKTKVLLWLINQHLSDRFSHAMVFVRNSDRIEEIVGFLKVYGFSVGTPGDSTSHIWVGTDDQESYSQIAVTSDKESLATLSLDCPQNIEVMQKRHSGTSEAIVLLLAREIPHFEHIISQLSYSTQPLQHRAQSVSHHLKKIREQLTEAISSEDLAPYYAILEPLMESYDPLELSAASLSLTSLSQTTAPSRKNPPVLVAPHNHNDWTRLFVSLGSMEGVTPSTLLGALAGESGVGGNAFGKIDIRETFSLVEVLTVEAEKIIKAVNGVTIRGRSTRVDYDRKLKPNK